MRDSHVRFSISRTGRGGRAFWHPAPRRRSQAGGEAQIVPIPREAAAGRAVKDPHREHGTGNATFRTWKSKQGGPQVSARVPPTVVAAPNTVWSADFMNDALGERTPNDP